MVSNLETLPRICSQVQLPVPNIINTQEHHQKDETHEQIIANLQKYHFLQWKMLNKNSV